MKVTNPAQKAALQQFIESVGVPYNEADKLRFKHYFDSQEISLTRAVETKFFGTSTSAAGLHTYGAYGCNLPAVGKLPGNTTFIVTEIGVELVEVITAAKLVDANKLHAYGLVKEFRVEDRIALDEFRLARAFKRSGMQPVTAGEGTGAAVINGVASLDDGFKLSVESRVVIGKDQSFGVVIAHNGAADLSVAMRAVVSLYGLEITHGA